MFIKNQQNSYNCLIYYIFFITILNYKQLMFNVFSFHTKTKSDVIFFWSKKNFKMITVIQKKQKKNINLTSSFVQPYT